MLCTFSTRLQVGMSTHSSSLNFCKSKARKYQQNLKCQNEDGGPNGSIVHVTTPLWAKCEDETHTPKSGNLESFGTPTTSELDIRGQNTLPWSVLYIVGKVLKCRCPKWPHISHLDICRPSYGQKKGRESNWQFDSRTLKVGNRPLLDVCRRSAIRHWKALEESYNFGLDLTPIERWNWEIWVPKVPRVHPGTVSGLLLGSPGKKCHSNVAPTE